MAESRYRSLVRRLCRPDCAPLWRPGSAFCHFQRTQCVHAVRLRHGLECTRHCQPAEFPAGGSPCESRAWRGQADSQGLHAGRARRALAPGALLGAIYNRQICLPISAAPQDAVAAGILDACWSRLSADPQSLAEYPPELAEGLQEFVPPGDMARIAQPIDWLGLNHYCPIYARADQGPLGFAW